MEIHSSSLAFYPASTKTSQSAKPGPKKIVELELNDFKKDQRNRNSSHEAVSTPDQIEKELGLVEPIKAASNNKPIDFHTKKALSAYNDTANQPLQETRSQLSSIDFYV